MKSTEISMNNGTQTMVKDSLWRKPNLILTTPATGVSGFEGLPPAHQGMSKSFSNTLHQPMQHAPGLPYDLRLRSQASPAQCTIADRGVRHNLNVLAHQLTRCWLTVSDVLRFKSVTASRHGFICMLLIAIGFQLDSRLPEPGSQNGLW